MNTNTETKTKGAMKARKWIRAKIVLYLLTTFIAQMAVILAVTVGFAVLILEWAGGCGEHYIDSKGVTHTNECWIASNRK